MDDSVTIYPVTATLSLAVKLLMATVRLVAVDGMVKAVTVGFVVSGSVMVTESLAPVETFPAASLAQAYRVIEPSEAKV